MEKGNFRRYSQLLDDSLYSFLNRSIRTFQLKTSFAYVQKINPGVITNSRLGGECPGTAVKDSNNIG